MARQLPPLNALSPFEAAVRLGSFTEAAAELHVTQSAVSHQIRLLEQWFGAALFVRSARAVSPTEAGRQLALAVGQSFDRIDDAARRLKNQLARANALTISVIPSFAAKWLVPRLGSFRLRHPDIDVWITTLPDPDLKADEIDIAIRYGDADDFEDLTAHQFLTEDLTPVCSPALLKGPHPLRKPSDLKFHTLLHDDLREDWAMWLKAAGVSGVDPDRGPGFDDSALLIQSAIDGQGVALGRGALIAADLAAGRLVKPFTTRLKLDYAYWLVCLPELAGVPKVQMFRDWVSEMAAQAAGAPDSFASPGS